MARATITKITEKLARKMYEDFCATVAYGLPPVATVEQGDNSDAWNEVSPKLCRDFEDSGHYGIVWEEGDYDWPFNAAFEDWSESVRAMGTVHVEANNGWSVTIYPDA